MAEIPAELCSIPHWVLWRYEERNGKQTKVPYSVSGKKASVTDAATWSTFEKAANAFTSGSFSGLGFVFTDSGFAGVDCDRIDQSTIDLVAWLNSYTEYSPSGNGVHIIVRGSVPSGVRRDGIEVYSNARYFTMTGASVHEPALPIRTVDLEPLWTYLGGVSATSVPADTNVQNSAFSVPDEDIYRQASVAADGEKFQSLWRGEIAHYNNDHSAADQALVNILAFYTDDREQIHRLWLASGLARKKTHRQDYVDRTITKAFDQKIPTVTFDLKRPEPPARAMSEGKESTPLDWPPGLLGEVAQYIFKQSVYPIREIAISGAIGLFAGICGRSYNINGTGLNQYVILLAPTGRGKEAALQGVNRIMREVGKREPGSGVFLGPEYVASSQALEKELGKSTVPSFTCFLGEVGFWIQSMHDERASENKAALLRSLLKLFSRSGSGDVLQKGIHSDAAKNVSAVVAPALSLYGESTQDTFYGALDERAIASGLIPRFLMIEYQGKRPEMNYDSAVLPDERMIGDLAQLCAMSLQFNQRNIAIDVLMDSEANRLNRQFITECDGIINAEHNDSVVQIWNRAALKTLKLAALSAIGRNMTSPVINAEDYLWAKSVVMTGSERLIQTFANGHAGDPRNAISQHAELVRLIDEYFDPAFTRLHEYRINSTARDAGFIPLHYINSRLRKHKAFKLKEPLRVINDLLVSLCSEGFLVRTDITQGTTKAVYYRRGS